MEILNFPYRQKHVLKTITYRRKHTVVSFFMKKIGLFYIDSFRWLQYCEMANLKDVHRFYCPEEIRMEKELRDIFVKGDRDEVMKHIKELLEYNLGDVEATALG